MPEEINLFVSHMGLATEGAGGDEDAALLSWADFEEQLNKIRETVKKISSKAAMYESYQDMEDDKRKHARCRYGPMEIYKKPITTNMAVGWHEEELFNDRFPKQQCAETKFADHILSQPQ